MCHLMIQLGILEQCLGWNAAPVVAGAATAFDINNGNAFAKLCCADGADIPGGSCSDNDEIV